MNEERLIEQVCSAHRERDVHGRVQWSPAWHDLDDAGRQRAFERTVASRAIEAALDERGQSTTVAAVLARIRSAG